jgi:hypothetical protein
MPIFHYASLIALARDYAFYARALTLEHNTWGHLGYGVSDLASMPVIMEPETITEMEENAGAEQSTILRGY